MKKPKRRFAGRPADPAAEALARARAGLERKPVRIVHRGVPEPAEPHIVEAAKRIGNGGALGPIPSDDDECQVCKWGER